MRKTLSAFAILLFISITTWAQAPNEFNYQGIARNSAGAPVTTPVSLQLSILDGSPTGTILYQENHIGVTTNMFGLFNVFVGGGAPTVGTFASVVWASGSKYMQVAIDPSGGTTFTPLGATQLLSVPYALYAASAGNNYTGGTGINLTGTTFQIDSSVVPKWDDTLAGNLKLITPAKLASYGYGTGSVTSVATGYGLSGGPVTTTGTVVADTSTLFTKVVSTFGAGTGVSISGRTITNTAPDQTVTLTGGAGISTSGTYPNFTITNTAASNYMIAEEQEPSGTNGGSSIVGWQTRTLNWTDPASTGTAITRSGNNITLNQAGTYYIKASAPALNSDQQALEIQDFTFGTILIHGTSEFNNATPTTAAQTRSEAEGFITVTAGTPVTFYLNQNIASAKSGNGLGVSANIPGDVEVYSKVFVQKIQ